MKKYWKIGLIILVVLVLGLFVGGCWDSTPSSDDIQNYQQEQSTKDAVQSVGFPAIKNYREKKIVKDIYELRDQEGLVTYTYVYSEVTGKYTYLGESIGYGIPYSTQFSNPEKMETIYSEPYTIPQAEPNGLFSPSSADGTWILLKTPDGKVLPQYIEPKISVFTYKLPERLLN